MGAAMALPPLTEALQPLLESLDEALHQRERERRTGRPGRRPVQVLYGGAHLFKPGAAARMGTLARTALDTYAPDGPTFAHALGISLSRSAPHHADSFSASIRMPGTSCDRGGVMPAGRSRHPARSSCAWGQASKTRDVGSAAAPRTRHRAGASASPR